MTRALHVAVPWAGAMPMASRRTVPVAMVFTLLSPAVRVTGTVPLEVKVSQARTRLPCALQLRVRLRTFGPVVDDDDRVVDEDDDSGGGGGGPAAWGLSPGISGSTLPKGTLRGDVLNVGVGTTNVSVVRADSAMEPPTALKVARAVVIAVAPLLIDGPDESNHHVPKTKPMAARPTAPRTTGARGPLPRPAGGSNSCLPIG